MQRFYGLVAKLCLPALAVCFVIIILFRSLQLKERPFPYDYVNDTTRLYIRSAGIELFTFVLFRSTI